ncbi:hypothetical protein, partial [Hoylesella loescheii]|uniref:hypothetical protein n=1 Tax=Hoylesella loescheii TaxID=840 RepID=UPI0004782738
HLLLSGAASPLPQGTPSVFFMALFSFTQKRPAQTWTANKQCLTLQTDGSCKPNLDFGEGHDNLNTT